MARKKSKSYFITGTGTDVGKTIAAAGIASLGVSLGRRVAVIKPVQTGTGSSTSDLDTIEALVPSIQKLPANIACPYSFRLPASPALASADENIRIDMNRILNAYDNAISRMDIDLLLVEGAGGLMVPLTDKFMMIDLISQIGAPVLLVCGAGLGTINHTLLSVEAMHRRKIRIAGFIVNRMPIRPGKVEKDNLRTIESFSGIPILAVINEINVSRNTNDAPANFADKLMRCMGKQEKLKHMMAAP